MNVKNKGNDKLWLALNYYDLTDASWENKLY